VSIIGRALFMRHGHTEYKDVYPDLTEQGINEIEGAADYLKSFVYGYKRRIVFCSPVTRTVGSADLLKKALADSVKVVQDPLLIAVKQRDPERAKVVFREYAEQQTTVTNALSYGWDSRYEDGVIFEPRDSVRARFFDHLDFLAGLFHKRPGELVTISVTHYELLYHFVEFMFPLDYKFDAPLSCGEIIDTFFLSNGNPDYIKLEVNFRHGVSSAVFDRQKKKLLHYGHTVP